MPCSRERFISSLISADLALEDQVGDQRRVEQDLDRGDPALALRRGKQALARPAPFEVQRQVHQQLGAPLFREEIDDAVERLVGAVGVQGGHAEVAGLGEGHRVFHGLAVAHLAHQDHVGRLAQGVLQRRASQLSVSMPSSRWVMMQFLCGCTNSIGSSMVMMWPKVVLVAVVDHRGQRSALARAGGAHEDDQAALGHGHVFEHVRQVQLSIVGSTCGMVPQHQADVALLHGRH